MRDSRRWKRNGWAVLIEALNPDGTPAGQKMVAGPPTKSLLKALVLMRTRPHEYHGFSEHREIVNHDEEMRRWNYTMGIIEPTPEERATLPIWHRNYETVPPRTPERKEFDDLMVADYQAFNKEHMARTKFTLTWEQWIEHVTGDKRCDCGRRFREDEESWT